MSQVIQDALQIGQQVARDYEVLIIDDGSSDRTSEKAGMYSQNPHVRLIRHPKNLGYGEALKSGFKNARMEWIFFSDGDSQFDLQELSRLLSYTSQADIVAGFRIARADPFYRTINQKVFGMAVRLFMGLRLRDVDCAFKLIRSEVVNHLTLKSSGAMINTEFLVKAQRNGARIAEVGISHRPRLTGIPTGAKLSVIGRAVKEFWMVWWDLHSVGTK